MSKDTSKLEEIRKALGLDSYGAKCTGLDCSHEIGVDHYIITDVHLADLLAWHREECLKIIGKDIQWEWKPYGEVDKEMHSLDLDPKVVESLSAQKVCSNCEVNEFDPETVHICELENKLKAEQRERLRASLEVSDE